MFGGECQGYGFHALVAVLGECQGYGFHAHMRLMVGVGFHAHVGGRKFIKRC